MNDSPDSPSHLDTSGPLDPSAPENLPEPGTPDDPSVSGTDEDELRHGPLWRHARWAVAITLVGVGMGWFGSQFRIGPEDYGLPSAAPGAAWPYLLAWTVIGLGVAAVLRATAARIPLYSIEGFAFCIAGLGVHLSLGWRPELPMLGAMALAALALAAAWSAFGLRTASRS